MKTVVLSLTLATLATLASAAPSRATEPRRDPFAAFTVADADPVVGGERRCKESVVACAALDDIALRAIVSGVASPRAMVETKAGTSVLLRVGDMLAKGRVKAIRRDGVVVERFTFSAVAGAARSDITLTLE